jgi:hypothetical protein
MILNIGDIFTLQERETKKWFAFQIIRLKEDDTVFNTVYIDLDYWSDRKPVANDLGRMQVLYLNHHCWHNKVNMCWSEGRRFPLKAEFVGNVPVLYDGECSKYGDWPDGTQQKETERWKMIPTEQITAYQQADCQWEKLTIVAGKEVPIGLYCVNDEMLDEINDYGELNKLPRLNRVVTTRYRPWLIPFLEQKWLIQELVWEHCGQKVLDVRNTHIEKLEVNDPDVKEIYLPQEIRNVTLRGVLSPDLRIYSHNDGCSLALIADLQKDYLPNVELPNLKDLILHNIKELDLSQVPIHYPNLIRLELMGNPGIIRNVSCIKHLKELERLAIHDLFGFSSVDFPLPIDLPNLQSLWLESIPAEAGRAIKRSCTNKIQDLSITKLRSYEWLQENMNNPLRHWDGKGSVPKPQYKKAVSLWKDAWSKIAEAAKEPNTFSESILSIALDYVEGFNKLDLRSHFIETEEREDIYNAFERILDEMKMKVNRDRIRCLMDNKRSW